MPDDPDRPDGPEEFDLPDLPEEEAAVAYDPEADDETALADDDAPDEGAPSPDVARARRRHEERLLAIDGVEGVGTTASAIVVFVRDSAAAERVPNSLDGVPVVTEESGEIRAF